MIVTAIRDDFIGALEEADKGDLRAFSDLLGDYARISVRSAVRIGQRALEGWLQRPNGNGGRTVGDRYYPLLEASRNPGEPSRGGGRGR